MKTVDEYYEYHVNRKELEITNPKQYDLYHRFDPKLHKQKYIHYLEVVIDKNGVVHYAVPSHQEYLIFECCRQMKLSRDEVLKKAPVYDFLDWLMKQTDLILVWSDNYLGKANEKQKETLQMLIDEGLLEIEHL